MNLHDPSDPILLNHPILGRFLRTTEVRPPRQGEYYLCVLEPGIGCAARNRSTPHEILLPWNK